MRSKKLAIGLSLLLVSFLVGACGPSPQSELMPAEPTCLCGEWEGPGGTPTMQGDVQVTKTAYWLTLPGEPGGGTTVGYFDCGETVTMSPPEGVLGFHGTVTLNSVISCIPEGCGEAVYTHYVIVPGGASTIEEAGNSVELTYGPPYGVYTVVLNATCNGETCTPCTILVDFEGPSETCQCGEWEGPESELPPYVVAAPVWEGDVQVTISPAELTSPGEPSPGTYGTYIDCGETVTLGAPGTVTLNSVMNCVPEGCGEAVYTHYIINPDGAYTITEAGNSVELTYGPPYGIYTVFLNATCNGEPCIPCTILVDFEGECVLTECGIINKVETDPVNWTQSWTGIIPRTVITFQECDGDAYTLYGDPALVATNDDTNTVSLDSYYKCKCARYCWTQDDDKKVIDYWTTVPIDDDCCGDCCLLCCEVDFSFIGSPFGGGGPNGGPPSLCPGQILIYQYNLTNNSDYEFDYHFSNSTPAGQIDYYNSSGQDASDGTVDANSGELITVHYQMPGNLNETCNQSSYTFTHDLNITIDPDGDAVECASIESSVFINCHNCPECVPKMHYPQYPDEDGWDVYSCESESQVADDWKCTNSGPISHIRFWGSWKDDNVGQISGFNVEIYSNSLEGGYSHPDVLLWDSFVTYSLGAVELAIYEGWYNPWMDLYDKNNHTAYYQYDITNIQHAFWQEVGNIYWLSIWPEVDGDAVWGWKSSENHFMDDACWRVHLPQTPAGAWQELYEPILFVQSLDLAFVICGSKLPCRCGEWGQAQVKWTNENGQQTSEFLDCQTGMGLTSIEGETITVHPSIICSSSCEQHIPTAEWQVIKNSTGSAIESGSGLEAHFEPDETGSYTVEFYNVTCDGVDCEDCSITLRVTLIRPS